ncbi:MAG: DUF4065 domain-containing protein [Ardenticatenaceae bacterium]|nr:DUF4065 domain-containing protein [Ardenticatenaceae bacterium]
MSENINALQLANFIVANYPDKNITPLKLQKLAYYAKAWSLVAGSLHIQADFQKWKYGPVNQEIYHAYKQYGRNSIPSAAQEVWLSDEAMNLLKFILDNYVNLSAFTLSAMTHNETPWQETEEGKLIQDEAIRDYFSEQPFARNFMKEDLFEGTFYLLQTDSWHAFTLDMSPDDVASLESFPSYREYIVQSEQARKEFADLMDSLLHDSQPSL